MPSWGILALLLSLFLLAAPTSAQDRTLVVQNEGGAPLNTAEVFVFWGAERVERHLLDPQGRVTLSADQIAGFRRIVVRHLGLHSEFLYPETLQEETVVRLTQRAIEIEGVIATVAPKGCPVDGSPAVRELMRHVASGYARTAPAHVQTRQQVIRDAQVADRLFVQPVTRQVARRWIKIENPDALSDTRRDLPIDQWIREYGVRIPNYHPFVIRFLNWSYPRFDGHDAVFFVSEHFVETADFRPLEGNLERIRFCYDGDALAGVIELQGDRIVRVNWDFGDANPEEAAGGVADFVTDSDLRYLLPRHGVFYRLMSPRNPELFFREHTTYSSWTTGDFHIDFQVQDARGEHDAR